MNKFLSKLGLSEPEQKLVIRAAVISTVACLVLIGIFWALNVYSMDPVAMINKRFGTGKPVAAAFETNDIDIEAHEFTARRYMQSGRPDAAIPHLQRVAAMRKGADAGFDALDRMVSAYLELGEFDKALETANNLLAAVSAAEDGRATTSVEIRKGIALYNLKEYGAGSEILQNVLALDPQNVEALCFMGQMEAAAEDGRSPTAERFFRRAAEADPDNAEVKYQFARYSENNGDYKTARKLLQEVLAKDPFNVRAHARLGMIYYYEFEPELALKSYQTALALNPYDYNTHYNLGELYRTQFENNELSLQEFVTALEHNPEHTEANYKAGLICASNGMMKEAIRYFEACLRNDGKNIRRLQQLAAAYERIGDKEAAMSIYRDIIDIDPLYSVAIHKIKLLEMDEYFQKK